MRVSQVASFLKVNRECYLRLIWDLLSWKWQFHLKKILSSFTCLMPPPTTTTAYMPSSSQPPSVSEPLVDERGDSAARARMPGAAPTVRTFREQCRNPAGTGRWERGLKVLNQMIRTPAGPGGMTGPSCLGSELQTTR